MLINKDFKKIGFLLPGITSFNQPGAMLQNPCDFNMHFSYQSRPLFMYLYVCMFVCMCVFVCMWTHACNHDLIYAYICLFAGEKAIFQFVMYNTKLWIFVCSPFLWYEPSYTKILCFQYSKANLSWWIMLKFCKFHFNIIWLGLPTQWLYIQLSVPPSVCPNRLLGILLRSHKQNDLKFGLMMYPEHS